MSSGIINPLSALAPQAPVLTADALAAAAGAKAGVHSVTHGFGAFVFWFILLTVLTWLIIYSLAPSWAQRPSGSSNAVLDTGKIMWTSIIIALVILLIGWLIKSFGGRC